MLFSPRDILMSGGLVTTLRIARVCAHGDLDRHVVHLLTAYDAGV